MPGNSTLIRCGPGKIPGNTNNPASLVDVLRATLVAVLVNVTLAFGITACPGSRTVPRTVALLACGQAGNARSNDPSRQTPRVRFSMSPIQPLPRAALNGAASLFAALYIRRLP